MKRIIFALLFTTLSSAAFARSTALTYALIRIVQNETCIAKAMRPIMPEVPEALKPLFIWSDDAFDTDLEGEWDHKITCDVALPTEKDRNAYVTMTSFYTLCDFGGSRTIRDETVFASKLSEETLHRQTFEGKNEIVVEVSFTQNPESLKR